MKELEITSLANPTLDLPDMSYGYSNERIIDTQIDVKNNRDILHSQYFALTLQCTSGNSSSTPYRIDPKRMGLNKQVNQSLTGTFLEGLGTSYSYLTTLSYSSDFNNDYIMLLPPGAILEVTGQVNRSTENLQVTYTGSVAFLSGATFTITSTTETRFTFINKGITHSKINLQYWDTSVGNPFFAIFMKLYY